MNYELAPPEEVRSTVPGMGTDTYKGPWAPFVFVLSVALKVAAVYLLGAAGAKALGSRRA